MTNKHKLYSIALVSTAMILMLVSIASAAPFAYVTNANGNSVSIIDTATNTVVGSPIQVESYPTGIAITPNGAYAYVTNKYSSSVSIIDTATNTTVGSPTVGNQPMGIAITPNGAYAYVTNEYSNNVSIIDTATNTTVGSPIQVGSYPWGIAITPNGAYAYVTNDGSNSVSIIDTATNTTVGSPTVGGLPTGIAITPNGAYAYVTNAGSDSVSVIDTAINTTVGSPIWVGSQPMGIAITPNGAYAYVTNEYSNSVSVINTTNNSIAATVPVGSYPWGIAITPNGAYAYVTNDGSSSVSVINTTNNSITATVTVEGNPIGIAITQQVPPTLTWNNPANITYGTALSGTQLDATSYESGTFAYNPATGTVLSAGINQQLNTTFTPTDTANYTTATDTVSINVTQATPTINWTPNPLADIVYGTTLGADLDATATDPITGNPVNGNFIYTDKTGTVVNAGTILSIGTHALTATFTPTDTTDYTSGGTVTNSITVTQATPTTPKITWSNPADITYGTKLSGTQLDASASVPGTFVYTPPSGTVLSAGTHTLDVSFTPTDTANYTTVSASVSINILTPTQNTVLTPMQKINQMITFVQDITTSGELNDGSSYELIAILNAAKTNLDRSVVNPFAEPTELRYFITQVKDKINTGVLSQTNGQILIEGANDIMNSLSNQVQSLQR
jgi:YVTN family beta-propeller protein